MSGNKNNARKKKRNLACVKHLEKARRNYNYCSSCCFLKYWEFACKYWEKTPQLHLESRGRETRTAAHGSPLRPADPPAASPLTPVCFSAATPCRGACVEVDSDTEAVANEGFKLGCISCKMRSEVEAVAVVSWYFKAFDDEAFSPVSDGRIHET